MVVEEPAYVSKVTSYGMGRRGGHKYQQISEYQQAEFSFVCSFDLGLLTVTGRCRSCTSVGLPLLPVVVVEEVAVGKLGRPESIGLTSFSDLAGGGFSGFPGFWARKALV